ncbi:MAG: hypothetical protein HN758_09545 [Verrucomicrobia bacterium]|jgi:serine/threonine protein kinase|nr:hypothetical protein [Verrucomicrobiota bacterium]MBT4276422.1 hypothetical protein [Verrucomicrobiota bacterium]MBT5479473.1 hypothetical protein [Verrucomicrobiota bacterium]MBT6236724.1 hypothetical protein [Verrucomicrobiota bacterium]MBT6805520.1 hypothetical protein [Verrucomicrobiota bacterium]
MSSPLKWLRRKVELHRLSARRVTLEEELTCYFKAPIRLRPASAKGGYDEIYLAYTNAQKHAVVRLNNPYKTVNDPIGPWDPGVPLEATGRLDREWEAYQCLVQSSYSPKPLWRGEDVLVCEWLDWTRASVHLSRTRNDILKTSALIFPILTYMHGQDLTHLDLNLGNFLLSPDLTKAVVIDFEFGPQAWVSLEQQMAFDYLRLLNDCLRARRGGKYLLEQLSSWLDLLGAHMDERAKDANLDFAPHVLKRLYEYPEVIHSLKALFPKLPMPEDK